MEPSEPSPLRELDRRSAGAVRRNWNVQRGAQVCMALLVVAALLGVFSQGPLSRTTVADPEQQVSVGYERFDRRGGGGDLDVTMVPPDTGSGTVELFLGDDLLDHYTIDAISPTPESVTAAGDGKVFEFSTSGADAVHIHFDLTARALGWESSTVGLADGTRMTFDQFFYP